MPLVLAFTFGVNGFSEDWQSGGVGPDGGKAFYDCDPVRINLGSKPVAALKHKYSFDGRFYAIFTIYLRQNGKGWEYAPKSQIEYNWDGSLKGEYITKDEDLNWSEYTFEHNEINDLRLNRSKKLLKVKK